ncbi:hypothetical protein VT50_0202685 [Streptomyces antioxidans]|uniref:Thioesterase domain-containing protein n=1 Tax=Streptomyces antioxidans TaxID=1507734 RepID=A0A1V4DBI7_9ACTN|nr:hypothetical protein [Streptomyces antioxidans]OPF83725.1 hypothetical protein VT50_0202685 [Streptomyces antioxidans]
MSSALLPPAPGPQPRQPPAGLPPVAVPHAGGTAHAFRRAGGTPADVLDDRGMRELAVARLLNDLASLHGFVSDDRRLTTPTAAYAGRTDRLAPPRSLARWTGAAQSVTTRTFDSGHFFPHDRTEEAPDAIRLDLPDRDAPQVTGRPHHTHRP